MKITTDHDIELSPIPVTRHITVGEFRRLFTLAERVAIEESIDPTVKVLMQDLQASTYIDLDSTELADGLLYLAATAELITTARKDEILAS